MLIIKVLLYNKIFIYEIVIIIYKIFNLYYIINKYSLWCTIIKKNVPQLNKKKRSLLFLIYYSF